MSQPIALDTFCCGGGVSEGLRRAGFRVVGVDIEPQPDYPFPFIQADVTTLDFRHFDLVWASPPCQGFTAYKRRPNHVAERPNLLPIMREKLKASGSLWVMENIPGAPLEEPITLCGSMFGLDVKRHRLFESNFLMIPPMCQHEMWTPRFPQATNRKNLRSTVEVGVWRIPLEVQQQAMGINWLSREKLSQAIPPAYSEWIGKQALRALAAGAA